jgi:hypothetical protein
MKTSVRIAVVVAAVATTMMAGSAQASGRLVTSVLPTFESGSQFAFPIRDNCIKKGTNAMDVAQAVMKCYIASLQSQKAKDVVLTNARITNWFAPKPGGEYRISWDEYAKGAFVRSSFSAQPINAYCPTGGLFNGDFSKCIVKESPTDCINRQLPPVNAELNAARKPCLATESGGDVPKPVERGRMTAPHS